MILFHASSTSRRSINVSIKVKMQEQIECLHANGNDREEGKNGNVGERRVDGDVL